MKKSRVLFILHRSPPNHGAARVGDLISTSRKLCASFDCKFIKIQASEKIADIGTVSSKKLYLTARLFARIIFLLATFRPEKIYFTASIKSVAFYRDVLLSIIWKLYGLLKPVNVYYHYHTKGVDNFVSSSTLHLTLTRFFVKKVNLILLSPLLIKDFDKTKVYQDIFVLPNGVKDPIGDDVFINTLISKYYNPSPIQILYLSYMAKEKGYDEVLNLARHSKGQNIQYQFAGNWQSKEDEKFFYQFVEEYGLEKSVKYHGYVDKREKAILFTKSHLLAYPSRNDAFPLTIIEALSYGVPVIATSQGSIPFILDENSGTIVDRISDFQGQFEKSKLSFINKKSANHCRNRFLREFSLEKFENNLIRILNEQAKV